jgi:hypothetical protein
VSDATVLKSGAATVLLEDSEREALEGKLLPLADEEGRTFFTTRTGTRAERCHNLAVWRHQPDWSTSKSQC